MTLKNKAKIILILLGILGIIFLMASRGGKRQEEYGYSEDYVQMKEIPAMLSFYYYTEKEWEETFGGEDFGELLNVRALDFLLSKAGCEEYVSYEVEDKKQVSRAEWNAVYGQMLDLLDEQGEVEVKEEVVLHKEEESIVCGMGTYQCGLEGLDAEPMDALSFYVMDGSVIGLKSLTAEAASLRNVYVKEADQEGLSFLFQGEERTLLLSMEDPGKAKGRVCDLLWEKGEVSKVQVKEDAIQGNLIAINEETIEIEGYGEIRRSEDLPVYKTYGTVEQKDVTDIVIANMKVKYVTAEDRVEAILLAEPAQIGRIRVLLLPEDGKPYREEVYVSSDAPFQVVKKKKGKKQPAGSLVRAGELFGSSKTNTVQLKTKGQDGLFYLCDASGERISNGYQGILELHRYQEGFTVVNELPIEQYLCAVVPSEMPASYPSEALKVQAVCARSYAYIQLEHGDYAAFGAHVDDTTNYQVYNKQERNEKTTAAVLDTAGMALSYQGEVVEAYYFSTSAGVTGNGDAWGLDQDPKYGYLRGGRIAEGAGEADLSREKAFAEYIAKGDSAAYENGLPFYRWKAVGDYASKEAQKKMRDILKEREAKTPKSISFFNQKKKEVASMKKFGGLKGIRVKKRGISGVILTLLLEYEKGTVTVENEYNIRALLGAGVTGLTLLDGSERESALLPSAYFSIERLEDGTYAMAGGGYGHGIGMSQNGAKAMAERGMSCEEILNFFYQGIEIKTLM